MSIKNIIKSRRKELKLSQLDVANACGVSEATVSRWESGDIGDMKRSRISALAKILKISPSILVGDIADDFYINESPSTYYGDHKKNLEYFADKPELLNEYMEIIESDNLRLLFDNAKELEPEDLESVLNIVVSLKKNKK